MGIEGGSKRSSRTAAMFAPGLLCLLMLLCLSLPGSALAAPATHALDPYSGKVSDPQGSVSPALPTHGNGVAEAQAAALAAPRLSPGSSGILSTPAVTRYDDTDWRIVYNDGATWRNITDSQASGGSYHHNNSGGYFTLTFTGTYLEWIATVSTDYGMAQVTLDDQAPVVVDLYRPSIPDVYQVSVWNTGELAAGAHTLTVLYLGQHNEQGHDSMVSVDAFDIAGTLVDPTGTIAGTVTSAGNALPNIRVSVFDHQWNELGYAVTNSSGHYTVAGLPKGSVAVCTLVSGQYIGEWYDNVVLPGNWEAAGATWLDLATTPSHANIDFSLQAGLKISGKVATSGGTALANSLVSAHDLMGTVVAQTYSSADGTYVIQGLPYGQYHVATENGQNYIDEWYSNVRFIGNPDATGATAITLSASSGNPSGINFSLDTGRYISGTVRDSNYGMGGVYIDVYNLSGEYLTSASTSDYGAYTVGGLSAGQYRIATYNEYEFVDEWYNDDPVALDPEGASATVIDVRTTSATNKNFVLSHGLMISGEVTTWQGRGLSNVTVRVQSTSGNLVVTDTTSDGGYWIQGLVPGEYVINTANDQGYVDEWYDNDSAPSDPTGANSKTVVLTTADVAGIDFSLDKGYTISGHVTDGQPGHGPAGSGVLVALYNSAGGFFGGAFVAGDPVYTTYALPAGTYYAKAADYDVVGFVNQWYKDLPAGEYTLADATPIDLTHKNATGVDFTLSHLTRYEQTDPHIYYTPTWTAYPAPGASGGSYYYSSATNAVATIYLYGTRLDAALMKGTTTGLADFYVDNVRVATADLSAATATYNVTVFTTGDLPKGPHKVEIKYNSANASGKRITLDAVDVAGELTYAVPMVTGLAPDKGYTLGGDSVVITGSNLSGATGVTFGGTPASSFQINSATQITAVTPAHGAGTVQVQVTTPSGLTADGAADDFTYVVPGVPTITSLSPNSGSMLGGTSVTINGAEFSGLSGPSAVTFDGVDATSYTLDSSTQITATSPAHAPGVVEVAVTTPTATSSTDGTGNDYTFTVPAPTVTGLSPATGPTPGGTSVTITGTYLTGATAVLFGGTAATAIHVDSDTQITATAPQHVSGTVDVTVITPSGTSPTAGTGNDYLYAAPMPTITRIGPVSGTTSGKANVFITGTGFYGAITVSFGGVAGGITQMSYTELTVLTPPHIAGTVEVTVTTDGGASSNDGTENDYTFVAPAPTVTSLSPTSGTTTGDTKVTLTGTGFIGATSVTFGAEAAANVTVVSAIKITCTSPSHGEGTVDVQVTTVGGTSPATGTANDFTYVAPVVATRYDQLNNPKIQRTGTWTDYANTAAYGGSYGRSLTSGASATVWFTGTKIEWIGMKGSTPGIVDVYLDDVKQTTLDLYSSPAKYQVVLWTSPALTNGIHHMDLVRSTSSLSTEYLVLDAVDIWGTIQAPPPTITSLSPSTGSTLGGDSVIITGANLTGTTSVTFGGVPAAGVTVDSAAQITALTPAHAVGTVRVQVTTPAGSTPDTAADDFAFTAPGAPTITSLSPAMGSVDGGTSVAIAGTTFTGLSGPAAVQFGGVNATSYVVNSSTKITAVAPAHSAGTVRVQVVASGGATPDTSADDFTYSVAPPVIRYDQLGNANILKTGAWTDYPNTAAYLGTYGRSSTAGATATVWFSGTQIDWIAMTGTTTGTADVYVDGVKKASINLASSPAKYQQNVWSSSPLSPGLHSFKIVNTSTKYITLDAVDIAGTISAPPTRYEQTDSHIAKVGSWTNFSASKASGASYGRSLTSGASATITFDGSRLDWIAMKGTTTGYAMVYLDDVLMTPTPIDLTATAGGYQVMVWSTGDLGAPRAHTVRIERYVYPNGTGSTKYLTLDAVDIWGSIQ